MTALLGELGFWDTLSIIFGCIGSLLGALIEFLIFTPFMLLWIGIAEIGLFAETAFKKLAGIDTIYLNGTAYGYTGSGEEAVQNGQDLVYAFITDNAVQNVFWSILALSIVLLFIMTIIALIKSEFTLDMKGSAKSPIIGRALKSLANFIIVPVASLISIIGMNFVTTSVYNMFGTENSSIVSKCFALGAYNANRARLSDYFAQCLIDNSDATGNTIFTENNPFQGKNVDDVANMIDEYFASNKSTQAKYNEMSPLERIAEVGGFADIATEHRVSINFLTMFLGYPNNGNFYWNNVDAINYYYNMAKFDYVLGLGSIIVMAWTLLTVCLVLVKRVFEMTILFLLAPVMTAIAPLDGGQAEKKWRQEFMKRLLAVIGPIFAFNMYFLLVPLFENISLFSGVGNAFNEINNLNISSSMLGVATGFLSQFLNVFDLFFQIVCILTGLSVIKSASALLSNLLGIDDLIKSGSETAKKAVDSGKKAFVGATAIGGVAMKGTAAAIKGTKTGQAVAKKVSAAKEKITNSNGYKAIKNGGKKIKSGANSLLEKLGVKANTAGYDDEISDAENNLEKDKESLTNKQSTLDDAIKNQKEIDAAQHAMIGNATGKKKAKIEKSDEYKALVERRKIADEKVNNAEKDVADSTLAISDKEKNIQAKKDNRQKYISEHAGWFDRLKSAYDSEYGEDSDKTNSLGKAAKWVEKNVGGKVKNIPILGKRVNKTLHSATDYFNINGDTAVRRLNDALGGLFGEGGGKELWEMNFKRNARDSLFMGVPESKAREQDISQSMLVGARDRYAKEEEVKKMKNDELKQLARYFAEQMHDPKYNKLTEDRENAEKSGDFEKVAKLDAQIDQMHVDMGAMQQAREFLPKSASDAGYQAWKSGIKDKATDDAFEKEAKDRAYTEGRKLKVEADMANQTLKTSSTDEDKRAIAEQMAKKINEAMQKGVPLKEISIEAMSEAIVKGTEASAKAMEEAIRNALSALNKK